MPTTQCQHSWYCRCVTVALTPPPLSLRAHSLPLYSYFCATAHDDCMSDEDTRYRQPWRYIPCCVSDVIPLSPTRWHEIAAMIPPGLRCRPLVSESAVSAPLRNQKNAKNGAEFRHNAAPFGTPPAGHRRQYTYPLCWPCIWPLR